jgi:hypothetical protein
MVTVGVSLLLYNVSTMRAGDSGDDGRRASCGYLHRPACPGRFMWGRPVFIPRGVGGCSWFYLIVARVIWLSELCGFARVLAVLVDFAIFV